MGGRLPGLPMGGRGEGPRGVEENVKEESKLSFLLECFQAGQRGAGKGGTGGRS